MSETQEKATKKVTAVILAAGAGSRMELGYNKILYKIEKPLLSYTIAAFENNTSIDNIILVTSQTDMVSVNLIVKAGSFKKVSSIIVGAETRQGSSYNGTLQAEDAEIVAVHDGARPFVTDDVITQCINSAREHGGSIAAVPANDTMKFSNEDGFVEKTINRDCLWSVQTPQTFKRSILLNAHKKAIDDNFTGTDESSLVERLGKPVKIIKSTYDNIKITTPEDLTLAEKIVQKRSM